MKYNEVVDSSKPYIIFDLDGTLANIDHRIRLVDKNTLSILDKENCKIDWVAFNRECPNDTLYKHIYMIYNCMCDHVLGDGPFGSIILTGRSDDFKEQTFKWLDDNCIYPDYFFMRSHKDMRSDVDYKKDIISKYLKNANILFVIEDRDRVVDMWRELGYNCLQCKKGSY